MTPDTQKFIQRLLDLYGGPERARKEFEADYALVAKRWDQDIATIGRILRAHLFIEHFLSEYLLAMNPDIGSLDKARLSFAQKLALVGSGNPGVEYLLPGIRHLNVIRNRLAHTLKADVSDDDVHVFLAITLFCAMREASRRRPYRVQTPSLFLRTSQSTLALPSMRVARDTLNSGLKHSG